MSEKKKITKKLENLLDTEKLLRIRNYKSDISDIISEVMSWWGFDLYSRKPGPAYVDNDLHPNLTDLDLVCFLYELSNRGAVINFPEYTRIRPKSIKKGQVVTSTENRHGKIIGLSANKETFNFSIRIRDMNIMMTDSVGDYRSFSLTNFDGKWYDGWSQIQFIPTYKENEFLKNFIDSTDDNIITFKNFIHPSRWTSLFGQYYITTKILIDRLTLESQYYYQTIKDMIKKGVRYSESPVTESKDKDSFNRIKDKGKSIRVPAFQIIVQYPKLENNEFPTYDYNTENLVLLTNKRKTYVYKIIPKLRFGMRSTELSYYKQILSGEESYPTWINSQWIKDYSEPGKRIKWDKLDISKSDDKSKTQFSLLRRIYQKSEIVDNDYDDYTPLDE